MEQMLAQITSLFPEFGKYFSAGFIVFARLLGFIRFAPVFNRKEINTTVKLSLAFMLTVMITPLVNPGMPPSGVSPLLLILLIIIYILPLTYLFHSHSAQKILS